MASNIEVASYDPKKVNLVMNGKIITGFASDSMITIARNEDTVTTQVGVKGDVASMMFQTYGNRNHPAVLFFHAMGVTGESSEPVANYLQDRYFCILPTSTVYCKGQKCNRCNTARPVPRPRRHRRGPPRSLQGAKAPYIWPASFCNTSRQSCSHGFQRLSPVPLDGVAGHSHHRADLAVRQFQDTMQYQDALSRLGQAGKGSGHQPVADLKLTAIGRKYKTVAGVLIYRA